MLRSWSQSVHAQENVKVSVCRNRAAGKQTTPSICWGNISLQPEVKTVLRHLLPVCVDCSTLQKEYWNIQPPSNWRAMWSDLELGVTVSVTWANKGREGVCGLATLCHFNMRPCSCLRRPEQDVDKFARDLWLVPSPCVFEIRMSHVKGTHDRLVCLATEGSPPSPNLVLIGGKTRLNLL